MESDSSSITLFIKLKEDLINFIKIKKLDENNIAYVNIDSNNWVSWHYFNLLKIQPKIWYYFKQEQFGTWSLPIGFKVVFRDYSWIEYDQCFDPYYSKWVHREPVKRAVNKYFEKIPYTPKYKEPIVLGDFLKQSLILPKINPKEFLTVT